MMGPNYYPGIQGDVTDLGPNLGALCLTLRSEFIKNMYDYENDAWMIYVARAPIRYELAFYVHSGLRREKYALWTKFILDYGITAKRLMDIIWSKTDLLETVTCIPELRKEMIKIVGVTRNKDILQVLMDYPLNDREIKKICRSIGKKRVFPVNLVVNNENRSRINSLTEYLRDMNSSLLFPREPEERLSFLPRYFKGQVTYFKCPSDIPVKISRNQEVMSFMDEFYDIMVVS